jgi:hypothetical protein
MSRVAEECLEVVGAKLELAQFLTAPMALQLNHAATKFGVASAICFIVD